MREIYLRYSKPIAAAVAGLCLMWGAAQAGNEGVGAAPGQPPEAVGATNDVVIIELGPAQGTPSAEDTAAMQMLLLQFLLMQSDRGGNAEGFDVPRAPAGVEI